MKTSKKCDEFLDNSESFATGAEERALVSLFRDVENLETPDPGPEYWNQFNYRLGQRLELRRGAKLPWGWQRLRLWPVMIGAAAIAILALSIGIWRSGAESDLGLAGLNAEGLTSLAEVLLPLGPGPSLEAEIGETADPSDMNRLLELTEFLYGPNDYNDELDQIDPQELVELWLEG